MKFGLQIPRFSWPGSPENLGERLAAIARTADEAGFASLWVMDHLFQIGVIGPAEDLMLEGYSTLAFMAAVTRRVRLGTMVTAVSYRHPGYLIKMVTTLDVLSGGRAWLGIGAGWNEREARGLSLPFPPLKTRFEQLEETLQLARRMWADDTTPFEGQHFQLAEPINHPLPLSKPRPPILIGGGGEKKTLRLVAQYADACNLFARLGRQVLSEKLDALKRHCDDVGRDYATIEKTALLTYRVGAGGTTARELIQEIEGLAALGFEQVIFSDVPGIETLTPLETIAREIMPAVKAA